MIVKLTDGIELLIKDYGKTKRSYFSVLLKLNDDEYKEIGTLYLKNVDFKIKTKIDEKLFRRIRDELDLIAKQLFAVNKMFVVETDSDGIIYDVRSVNRINFHGFRRDDEHNRIYHKDFYYDDGIVGDIRRNILIFSNDLIKDINYLIENIFDDYEDINMDKFVMFLKEEDEELYKKFVYQHMEGLV